MSTILACKSAIAAREAASVASGAAKCAVARVLCFTIAEEFSRNYSAMSVNMFASGQRAVFSPKQMMPSNAFRGNRTARSTCVHTYAGCCSWLCCLLVLVCVHCVLSGLRAISDNVQCGCGCLRVWLWLWLCLGLVVLCCLLVFFCRALHV